MPAAMMSAITANHGNIDGRYRSMAGSITGVFFGQIFEINRVRVDRIKSDDRFSVLGHDPNPKIVGFRQLVCCLFKEIIDLCDTTGKSRSIVPGRIKRLNDKLRGCAIRHYLEITTSR